MAFGWKERAKAVKSYRSGRTFRLVRYHMLENAKWITENKTEKEAAVADSSKKLSTGEVVASVINPEGRFDPAPVFEKKFLSAKKVKNAVLHASACGLYRISVNGECLNRGLFDPGWTDYEKRIQYQTYDVTFLLKNENRLEILAGCGWACAGLLGAGNHFFTEKPCVIAELEITYDDGEQETVVTDETWDIYHSCLLFTHPYQGEVIDYAKEAKRIGKAVTEDIHTALIPQEKEYVTPHERLSAKRLFVTPKGDTVIDFGQNMAGFAEVKINGRKGDKVTIRHAETLDENGNFYVKNLRTAAQTMEYTLGHDGENLLKPIFTFQGFRYIAVETEPKRDLVLGNFTAAAVYTDMKRTGFVESGNEKLNQLCECILWNMRSNFLEVPTDCPQRDERLGWLGDAQVFCRSAGFYYDVYRFYRCWLRDIVSEQHADGGIPAIAPYNRHAKDFRVSAAWADAITIIPMTLYEIYGDKAVLEECYPAMFRYVEYLRKAGPEEYLWLGGNHYGDWLALDEPDPRHPKTDKDMIASAYYFHTVELLIRAGEILCKPKEETEKQKALRDNIREAFRARFFNYRDTYAACTLLLCFGLLNEEERPEAAKHLSEMITKNEDKLLCGVVGAPLVLHALSENGYAEKAYDLLLSESMPSWMSMLKYGATTLWERPDTFTDEGMKDIRNASLNHYMFGAVLDWIVGRAGGLMPLQPGYRQFSWKPLPEKRLGKLTVELDTAGGHIGAGWEITKEGKVRYELTVPKGTEALVTLPGGEEFIVSEGKFFREQ